MQTPLKQLKSSHLTAFTDNLNPSKTHNLINILTKKKQFLQQQQHKLTILRNILLINRSISTLKMIKSSQGLQIANHIMKQMSNTSVFSFTRPKFDGEFEKSTLLKKTRLNHDSYIFRFELPTEFNPSSFKPGSHFVINGIETDEHLKRKYTPIQPYNPDTNYIDTLIKIYRPNVHPMFPDGGKLTPRIENLEIGESVLINGPLTSINYEEQGKFRIRRFKQLVDPDKEYVVEPKHVYFIAGGTGIAPFFSMLQQLNKEKWLKTKATVIFGNKTIADVVLKDQLDALAKENPNIQIIYAVDSVEEGATWNGEIGQINERLVKKYVPLYQSDNYVMICGSSGMRKGITPAIKNLGYPPHNYLFF